MWWRSHSANAQRTPSEQGGIRPPVGVSDNRLAIVGIKALEALELYPAQAIAAEITLVLTRGIRHGIRARQSRAAAGTLLLWRLIWRQSRSRRTGLVRGSGRWREPSRYSKTPFSGRARAKNAQCATLVVRALRPIMPKKKIVKPHAVRRSLRARMTGSLDPTRHTDGEENARGGEPFQSSMQPRGVRARASLHNSRKLHRGQATWERDPQKRRHATASMVDRGSRVVTRRRSRGYFASS